MVQVLFERLHDESCAALGVQVPGDLVRDSSGNFFAGLLNASSPRSQLHEIEQNLKGLNVVVTELQVIRCYHGGSTDSGPGAPFQHHAITEGA